METFRDGISDDEFEAMQKDLKARRPNGHGLGFGATSSRASRQSSSNADSGTREWPIMGSEAMHGIVGRIAQLATENSEADPVAVVATTLAYAAAEFGRAQFTRIGENAHHSRHFYTLVGRSSRARKGTSLAPVERIFTRAEAIRLRESTLPFPSGCSLKVSGGPLSSGEGLIYAIRDGKDEEDDGAGGDRGVPDKRLLVVEQELGAALRVFQRKGNNLSMILRRAFDGQTLEPLTKNDRLVATDPHINIVGHITRHELKSLLAGTEIWNGFANRFQWLMVHRPKLVAFPKPMPDDKVEELAKEIARAVKWAHEHPGELVLSSLAEAHWERVYRELTRDNPGILDAVTSRQEAHARRLALTYAQLDTAKCIDIHHLGAALAFCRFSFESAVYLFGEAELDPNAQKIIEALTDAKRNGLKGLTQTQIMALFHRNMKAEDLDPVLKDLQERGRITLTKEKTGERGRPPSLWRIHERNESNERNGR